MKAPERAAPTAPHATADTVATFELDGEPFCFAGANNYYLAYKEPHMVDDVFASAKALKFRVMRMWGFIDIGSLDGSRRSVDDKWDNGKKDGAYFQYWDGQLKRPVYNDGPDGLRRLDYALARASETDIKVILVLTNNWNDFGGIAQYVQWFSKTTHHEFYSDPEIRHAYKNWVAHLVNRRNTVTGRLYRDDPAIFAWELANEPRIKGTAPAAPNAPTAPDWTLETIRDWVAEMSSFIKSIDPHHMVSVGDEGFLNGGGDHWAYKANDGVDHEALTAVSTIDFGTFHLYPEDWGASLDWGREWILDHIRVARRLGKPTILEEFGIRVDRDANGLITTGLDQRLQYYSLWNETLLQNGGSASMPWILSGVDSGPNAVRGLYKDYDRYTLYRGDETATLMAEFARRFSEEAPACSNVPESTSARSRFVRVRGASPSRAPVAMAWVGAGAITDPPLAAAAAQLGDRRPR